LFLAYAWGGQRCNFTFLTAVTLWSACEEADAVEAGIAIGRSLVEQVVVAELAVDVLGSNVRSVREQRPDFAPPSGQAKWNANQTRVDVFVIGTND
jgi:hypothetical protein